MQNPQSKIQPLINGLLRARMHRLKDGKGYQGCMMAMPDCRFVSQATEAGTVVLWD